MLQIKRSELKQLAQDKLGNGSIESQNKILVMISTSLAARTSYTVVGDETKVDYKKMLELHDRLIAQNPPHSSPFEHCARVMNDEEYQSFRKGKHEVDLINNSENSYWHIEADSGEPGWCKNLKGFLSYRSILEGEK